MKYAIILTVFATTALIAPMALAQDGPDDTMSFFLTSVGRGDGANLGGLAGADAHCYQLATQVGAAGRTWRAYLSTTGPGSINAKDRIGAGPWVNYAGVQVAASVVDLHSDNNNLSKQTVLSEQGEVTNGRGDTPNRHDILTGSNLDGTALVILAPVAEGRGRGRGDDGGRGGGRGGRGLPPRPELVDMTCRDWTSNQADGGSQVGHFDRDGGGANPASWNSAHTSNGCGQRDLQATGGDGLFYCFAID